MYAYINGQYTFKSPTEVYIDIQGVGYHVHISLNTYAQIESLDAGKLYTYLHVKEDAQILFGFHSEEEKKLFILLLSVSGIGPNTARIILSSMTPIEVRTAILSENDAAFKKVKGVGPKTAKRVILDLKDKVKAGNAMATPSQQAPSSAKDQAMEALVALGFQRQKVSKVFDKLALTPEMSTEEVIKKGLQSLT